MKPATPLPQGVPPDGCIYIGNLYTTPRTIAEWRAKADAYPELVAIAKRALNQSARVHPDFNDQITNLLAKLGESA